MPGRMLVDPGDVGLALDTQYFAPLAFRPGFFLAFRSSLGKHRNIPSGETVCAQGLQSFGLSRHSGMRLLAQARNPYSLQGLWIPDSRCACPGMTWIDSLFKTALSWIPGLRQEGASRNDADRFIFANNPQPSLRAKRSNPSRLTKKEMDCFAALAMTVRFNFAFSRRSAPEVCWKKPP
jgi:hypothetical protein